MAERERDPASRRRWLTFVVVGAGPTGVELAGQLAELSRHALRRNFRRIDPVGARIVLVDAAPTVLGAFPESLRRRALQDLRDIGVEVHLGAAVTHVDERGLSTSAADASLRRIEAATKIWAAGVQASPLGRLLAAAAGADLDRPGRVKVDDDCALPGHPEVFVIGDLMSLGGLPGVSQVAIQSGRHAADTIRRRLEGHGRTSGGDAVQRDAPETRFTQRRPKGDASLTTRPSPPRTLLPEQFHIKRAFECYELSY